VFGNPSPSGLLKIPNDRRQRARSGILAPDNPPLKMFLKKTKRADDVPLNLAYESHTVQAGSIPIRDRSYYGLATAPRVFAMVGRTWPRISPAGNVSL
jgi:hypothetical protein